MGSDCRMGALAGQREQPSSQALTICTANCSVDISPQPNTPPGRAHAPEGQRCLLLLLRTRKSQAACPRRQEEQSSLVAAQAQSRNEQQARAAAREHGPGGEPALRTALLRPQGHRCRGVGQRASGAGLQWAWRGGWFPWGRTEDRDCVREPHLARKFKSTGAGPPCAGLRSWGRPVSVPGPGRPLCGGGIGEWAAPCSARPCSVWEAAGFCPASGYQCLESTSSGRRLSFLRLS